MSAISVLVVGINYAPETTGIAPYTTALARALAEAGHEVEVVTGIPHYPQWQVTDPRHLQGRRWTEVLAGIPVTRVRHSVPPTASLAGRVRMEADFFLGARHEIARSRAEVVLAVSPSLSGAAAAVSAARGRPVGVVVQDLIGAGASESGSTGTMIGTMIGRAEMAALRRAALLGVITPRFGEILVSKGVAAERVVPLPNFTHIGQVPSSRAAARARLGWSGSGRYVVHTGNMGMKQGLDSVVAAARESDRRESDVRFMLVGDGNQRARLKREAAGIQRLDFVDPVSEEAYPLVLAAADVLLLHERPGVLEMSMPSKVTSYVGAARPILAAVEPGGITATELARFQAAQLAPAGTGPGLLDAAVALLDDPIRQNEVVEGAGRMRTQYDPLEAQRRYQDFAERLLALGTLATR